MLFFELIQVAIGNKKQLSRTPNCSEWEDLFRMAQKQAMVGICFYGLQKLQQRNQLTNLSSATKLQWFAQSERIRQRNTILDKRCHELQVKLNSDGFRSYIMKGQGNAVIYRDFASSYNKTLLGTYRQSGDIDVFLDGGYKKIIPYVMNTHPTKEVNNLEIKYYCFRDVVVEIHYKPFLTRNPLKNRILLNYFKDEGEKCFTNTIRLCSGTDITTPTLAFNLVHQLIHIHHHLITDGIGLRQLTDYFFLVSRVSETSVNTDEVLHIIKRLGIERFASGVMWVLKEVFGLENEKMLWEPNEKDGLFILREIISNGNFGHFADHKRSLSNKWTSFWYVNYQSIRFFRFDHWAWFWTPLWRLYHYCWRVVHGYK